jgi:hypothetical protein
MADGGSGDADTSNTVDRSGFAGVGDGLNSIKNVAELAHRSPQETAALRDFYPVYVRFGSKAAEMISAMRWSMSALPRKADKWLDVLSSLNSSNIP